MPSCASYGFIIVHAAVSMHMTCVSDALLTGVRLTGSTALDRSIKHCCENRPAHRHYPGVYSSVVEYCNTCMFCVGLVNFNVNTCTSRQLD